MIALRVPPEDVRDLYHTWLVGLWAGELQRPEPALPQLHDDRDVVRRVTPVQLSQLLMSLPEKQSTRLSVARMQGEFMIPDENSANGFVEYRNLNELGGFNVSGPVALADLVARVGVGRVPCDRIRVRPARPALGGGRALGRGGELDGDKSEESKDGDARPGSTSNRASAACAIAEGDRRSACPRTIAYGRRAVPVAAARCGVALRIRHDPARAEAAYRRDAARHGYHRQHGDDPSLLADR